MKTNYCLPLWDKAKTLVKDVNLGILKLHNQALTNLKPLLLLQVLKSGLLPTLFGCLGASLMPAHENSRYAN